MLRLWNWGLQASPTSLWLLDMWVLLLLLQPVKGDVKDDAFAVSPGSRGRGQLPPLGWSQQKHGWPCQINPIPVEKRDVTSGDKQSLTQVSYKQHGISR